MCVDKVQNQVMLQQVVQIISILSPRVKSTCTRSQDLRQQRLNCNAVQTAEIPTGNILHEDLLVARQGIRENCALLGYFAQRNSYLLRGGSLISRKEYAFVCYLHV